MQVSQRERDVCRRGSNVRRSHCGCAVRLSSAGRETQVIHTFIIVEVHMHCAAVNMCDLEHVLLAGINLAPFWVMHMLQQAEAEFGDARPCEVVERKHNGKDDLLFWLRLGN